MAVLEKDVTITVSNMTITVDILFPPVPGYDPLLAQVTVKRLSDGQTFQLGSTKIPGGARFEHTDKLAGPYDVSVVCSDKAFGDMVKLPGNSKATFHANVVQ